MQGTKGNENSKVVSVCTLEDEILINRPPKVVWDKAVRETSHWWREDLKKGSLGVYIEESVGGRIWERFDSAGSGMLYGTVVAIQPPCMIHFTSTNSIAGVALCAYTWQFNRCADGTLVSATVEVLSEYPERLMYSLVKRRIKKLLKELRQYCLSAPEAAGSVKQPRVEVAHVSC